MEILKIKKYWRLYGAFVKNSLIHQMEYRVNFIMFLCAEASFVFLKVFYVMVLYNTDVDINGIPAETMLLFGGTFMIITGLYTSIFMSNIIELSHHIRTGFLDTLITKPVSLQFILSCRRFDLAALVANGITGIVMLFVAFTKINIKLEVTHILGFIILIFSSLIISYATFFCLQLISFWTVKSEAITRVLEVLWDSNNMPMTIYSKSIQNFFTFIIPLFVISNFPPMFILGKLTVLHFVWAIIAPFIFIGLNRSVWKYAMKNYTSASS